MNRAAALISGNLPDQALSQMCRARGTDGCDGLGGGSRKSTNQPSAPCAGSSAACACTSVLPALPHAAETHTAPFTKCHCTVQGARVLYPWAHAGANGAAAQAWRAQTA